jgi:hypothetical protein
MRSWWEALATRIHVHDEPMPGSWFCGRCGYANGGSACTKCWAPRHEGTERALPAVSGEGGDRG